MLKLKYGNINDTTEEFCFLPTHERWKLHKIQMNAEEIFTISFAWNPVFLKLSFPSIFFIFLFYLNLFWRRVHCGSGEKWSLTVISTFTENAINKFFIVEVCGRLYDVNPLV